MYGMMMVECVKDVIPNKLIMASPSLRLSLANSGPWLPETCEELRKEDEGRFPTRERWQTSEKQNPEAFYSCKKSKKVHSWSHS